MGPYMTPKLDFHTPKRFRIDTGAPLDTEVINNKKNRASTLVITIQKSHKNNPKSLRIDTGAPLDTEVINKKNLPEPWK